MKRSLKAMTALTGWTIIVTLLSLMPDQSTNIEIVAHQDKVMHVFMYAVMAFLMMGVKSGWTKKWAFSAFLLTNFYGFLMECLQGLIATGRYFDYLDIIANIIGSLTGILIYYLLRKKEYHG